MRALVAALLPFACRAGGGGAAAGRAASDCPRCSDAVPRAPVVHRVTAGGSRAVVPAGVCVRCAAGAACRSARVDCPERSGGEAARAVQRVWAASPDCDGPPSSVVRVPPSAAECPAAAVWGVETLDLERFVPKLLRDHKELFPGTPAQADAKARAAVREYRRMLALIQADPSAAVVPSRRVDMVWHEHVLDTKRYRADCDRMFGRFVDHAPSFGGAEEKQQMLEQQRAMLLRYAAAFGDAREDVWPRLDRVDREAARARAVANASAPAAELPDCCSFTCVKPGCTGCVGCSATWCGYRATEGGVAGGVANAAERGYMPYGVAPCPGGSVEACIAACPSRIDVFRACAAQCTERCADARVADPAPVVYDFTVTPLNGMQFSWSVRNDTVLMQQSVEGDTWYAVGLTPQTKGMGFADYMVTLSGADSQGKHWQNYTGVFDMGLWHERGAGDSYPCFDTLHECSSDNTTMGTSDIGAADPGAVDACVGGPQCHGTVLFDSGRTVSTWSRKLDTGDVKDWPITTGAVPVIFAQGSGEPFLYHKCRTPCTLDFGTGAMECGGAPPGCAPADTPAPASTPAPPSPPTPAPPAPATPVPSPAPPPAAGWRCTVCAHVYDPAADGGGAAFADLPDSWACPICGAPKSAYSAEAGEGGVLRWAHRR